MTPNRKPIGFIYENPTSLDMDSTEVGLLKPLEVRRFTTGLLARKGLRVFEEKLFFTKREKNYSASDFRRFLKKLPSRKFLFGPQNIRSVFSLLSKKFY